MNLECCYKCGESIRKAGLHCNNKDCDKGLYCDKCIVILGDFSYCPECSDIICKGASEMENEHE